MDKLEILKLLELKIKHGGLRLPSYIDFSISHKTLSIVIGKHNSKKNVIYSCCVNQQSDEAAFEGWAICIKHHLYDCVDAVILKWESPLHISANEELHYNRFLYRVIHFKKMFKWFDYDSSNSSEVAFFAKKLKALYINTPLTKAKAPSAKSSKEKQIEYSQQNLDLIKKELGLININHQLPVGVKSKNASFFTGGASGIDIWGIDENKNLNIFELKYKNSKVGIISEILFYSEVMYDVFISKSINVPSKIKLVRDAEYLYGNKAFVINNIKSHFLFDTLHPMVSGTTALLNTNNLGIDFFNIKYKLKPKSLLFNHLQFKGAFQMEEERRQAFFLKSNNLKGYSYLLNDYNDNIIEDVLLDSKKYFSSNKIAWWKYGNNSDINPTNHMVSSQIQCLNFLFALRKDKIAVLALAKLFDSGIDDILETSFDTEPGYIAFEFIYENEKLLGENDFGAKRGKLCTSIDAFIIAKKKNTKILIPVEWKYTETYLKAENKAFEMGRGQTRQRRYNHLIQSSKQLKTFPDLANSIYYYEPFYEFMRQTLLVEQMVLKGVADDFLHIVIAPAENRDLLDNNYSFTSDNLENAWCKCINDQSKFKIIDSRQILNLISTMNKYSDLSDYLKKRYY